MSLEITLNAGQRRAAAIILATIPLVLMVLALLPTLSAYMAYRDNVAVLSRSVITYEAAIVQEHGDRAALARLKMGFPLDNVLFAAGQPSLAADALQSRVIQIAVSAHAKVLQSSARIERRQGSLMPVAASVSLEGDIAALTRVLVAIEDAKPLIFVRRCIIRDPDGEQDSADANGPNLLRLELDVAGFVGTT